MQEFTLQIMLKSPDPDFCPFANYLLGSFLNIFESVSDLKVICAQRPSEALEVSKQAHNNTFPDA